MTADDFRALALALPDVVEGAHHGKADFRTGGRIFATLLITLGVALASIRARNLSAGLAFALGRVVVAGMIAQGIGLLLGLDEEARGILMVMMCMPMAVYNYLFAQKAGRSPEFVASLVMCSTLSSFIYLPLMLMWVI